MSAAQLVTRPNFHRTGGPAPPASAQACEPGDAFIEHLLAAHRGLDDAASQALHARLVLLLANHIGDLAVLDEALAAARAGLDATPEENAP